MIVNSANINSVPINRIVINTVGGIGNKNNNNIPALSPIASYRNYDRTNDDPDRDMLIDITGNGHHIKLYNFLFAKNSGYGFYQQDFNEYNYISSVLRQDIERTANKFIIKAQYIANIGNYALSTQPGEHFKVKINVKGLPSDCYLVASLNSTILAKTDGVYDVDLENPGSGVVGVSFALNKVVESCNVIIEQIPDYKGALVSDGVNNYGLCDNFPILSKEKGFTLIGIRKWLDNTKQGVSYAIGSGASLYSQNTASETYNVDTFITSYTAETKITGFDVLSKGLFYHTSQKYNDLNLTKGNSESYNGRLFLFTNKKSSFDLCSSIALYALEIYNRDLTDEEIEQVKARMIAEYEEKTGNRYDETGALEADYEAYDKTNDDDSRAVLEDLTGNGHNINLYNFGYNAISGFSPIPGTFKNAKVNSIYAELISQSSYSLKFRIFRTTGITSNLFNIPYSIDGLPKGTYIFNNKSDYEIIIGDFNLSTISYNIKKGINKIEIEEYTGGGTAYFAYSNESIPEDTIIELEIISEYKGALVSDGIDDNGLCENFPIFNITDGYTVLMIRKLLLNKGYILSKSGSTVNSAFVLEGPTDTYSFGKFVGVGGYKHNLFVLQTSKKYNGVRNFAEGNNVDTDFLVLFKAYKNNMAYITSAALYALKIYNRDLTDEEIEIEKEKMIKRYEEKTGEKYIEEV